ncbi:MAG: CDP-alcohol phosphatidyltransferase family protein [Deltaproteobacteria bacterium]|nr:CDP-alcohol phosphatidyltransferase family protein [Deltaproteobacteria bacterium]
MYQAILNFYVSLFLIMSVACPLLISLLYSLFFKKISSEMDHHVGGSLLLHKKLRNWWIAIISPLESTLFKTKLSSNTLTLSGLFLSFVSGILFSYGYISLAGAALILNAVFDILDGRIARRRNKATRMGAFLDSFCDRIGEIFIFTGLLLFFRLTSVFHIVLIILLTSFLISYARARAEGLGFYTKVGLIQRAERLFILIIASCTSPFFEVFGFGEFTILIAALDILAILSVFTLFQRCFSIYSSLRSE